MDTLKQNGIPLYHQLKEIFLEKIMNGEWQAGQMIPNETQLYQQYGVSRGPVRQALEELVREGILARKQGRGTWVLPPKIERDLGNFYSFTNLIEQRGLASTTQLLSCEIVPSGRGVAQSLGLTTGDRVVKLSRLRLADGDPLILEAIYVPDQRCPGLAEKDLEATPLYELLATCYDLRLTRSKQFLEPVIADEYEAHVLGISRGAPLLLMQNITYAADLRPVVLSKAVMRGDRVRYFIVQEAQL